MDTPRPSLPYKIRVSARARHVRLRLTPDDGLTVVVPRGFDLSLVPDIVTAKAEWIRDADARLRDKFPDRASRPLPENISLAALGEMWTIEYQPRPTRRLYLREHRTPPGLIIRGGIADVESAAACLRAWLNGRARHALPRLLAVQSRESGLTCSGVSIRAQRSRWGSCSATGHINLNRNLLFLPPELCRIVLLHELCHTRHMNHSTRFWDLLTSLEPQARAQDSLLNRALSHIPWWAAATGRM